MERFTPSYEDEQPEQKPSRLRRFGEAIVKAMQETYKYGGPYAMGHGVPPFIPPELDEKNKRLFKPEIDGHIPEEEQ